MTAPARCPVAAAVAALPVCPKRKLPIPFSAARDDKRPEVGMFTVADPVKVEQCHRYRLCGVCGGGLGYWIAFVGGSGSASPGTGAYQDPPMHEECAEAAMRLCPYIAKRRVPRRTPPVDVLAAHDSDYFIADKPSDGRPWVMVITRRYRTQFEKTKDGSMIRLFLPDHSKIRFRRFEYDGDDLAEVAA